MWGVSGLPLSNLSSAENTLYQAFYNLKENPFRLTPDPSFLFMTTQHQEALSGLVYSVCTRPGLTALIGEAGTGKTTLLYSLLGLLEKRQFVTALCTNPTLTRDEFYDTLLMKFGVDCASSLKSRQLAALEESLRRRRAEGRPSVLVIDEAQRLSPELLEEIRLLLNMETETEKLLQIIIAGQPELDDILSRVELRQFKQRISCVCKLKPLTIGELKEYLHHRLTHAGLQNQNLFPEETIGPIYAYSQGIPRLINSVCDGALQTGLALRSARITASIVNDVAKDLGLARPAGKEELPPETPMGRVSAATVSRSTLPERLPVDGAGHHGKNGNRSAPEIRMPFENYASRQKSVSFFGSLMSRLKQG
jgi:general secretion pathway protein A